MALLRKRVGRAPRVIYSPTRVIVSPTGQTARGMVSVVYDVTGFGGANRTPITAIEVWGKAPRKAYIGEGVSWDFPERVNVRLQDGTVDTFVPGEVQVLQVFGGTDRRAGKAGEGKGADGYRGEKASLWQRGLSVLGSYEEGLDVLCEAHEILGAAPPNYTGRWQAGRAYFPNESVLENQAYWIALQYTLERPGAGSRQWTISSNPVEPMRYRGAWDKYQTYATGDSVWHGGRFWSAAAAVTPPWFPQFSSGDVPGASPLWMLAPESVMGGAAGGYYTDKATVKAVQNAVLGSGQADPKDPFFDKAYQLGARMWPPTPEERARIVDGIIGPNTRAAVRRVNERTGNSGAGDNINDATLTALSLKPITTPKPAVPKPAVAAPVAAPTPPPPLPPTGFAAKILPGVPLWQAGLAAAAAVGLGYGVYRAVRR